MRAASLALALLLNVTGSGGSAGSGRTPHVGTEGLTSAQVRAIADSDALRFRTEGQLRQGGPVLHDSLKTGCGGRLVRRLTQYRGSTATTPLRCATRAVSRAGARSELFYYDDRGVLRGVKTMLRNGAGSAQRLTYLDRNAQLVYVEEMTTGTAARLTPLLRPGELVINPAWEFALASSCL